MNLGDRALRWARGRRLRVGGHNPWEIAVRTLRSSAQDRITGLAAEMAFFALLSLVPLVVAIGAALGFLERFVGTGTVTEARETAIGALRAVFSPQVTDDVLEPLVTGLLGQQRGGTALTGLVVALYLASRVFTATIRALDSAYGVAERRGFVAQRLLALGLALGSVLVVAVMVVAVVVGPLLGGGHVIAARLGLGEVFVSVWELARWPGMLMVAVAFLATTYHVAPNARTTWWRGLPGAVVGVAGWALASVGLRGYLAALGTPGARFTEVDAVGAVGGVVGALVAVVLWVYLLGLALLLGGELNSELDADRRRPAGSAPPD